MTTFCQSQGVVSLAELIVYTKYSLQSYNSVLSPANAPCKVSCRNWPTSRQHSLTFLCKTNRKKTYNWGSKLTRKQICKLQTIVYCSISWKHWLHTKQTVLCVLRSDYSITIVTRLTITLQKSSRILMHKYCLLNDNIHDVNISKDC